MNGFSPVVNPWSNYDGLTDSSPDAPTNGTDGGGNAPSAPNTPCAPDHHKEFKADGSFECVPNGNVYGCPGDQVKINLDANGKQGAEVCVSQAEAQRRNQLWIGANPGEHDKGEPKGGSSSSTGAYKPPTYTPRVSPYDAEMSKTLFENLTKMINGEGAPFGADTIARLQAAALQSNKSQLAGSRTELQKRLINSGLSRSGVAPSSYQKLESAAGADLSNNFRAVATTAVQKNYEAKVTALNQAQQFLQSERANALSQDQLILAYARLNQEWKTTQAGFDQQWKIIQNGNEQDMMKLLLCLRTGVC